MSYLQSNILKNFKIVKSFIPNSNHPNFYVEIYIDNKKIKRNLKNFKFTNLIILLKYRLIKKLFINRITRKFYKYFIKHFDTGGKIKHKISLKFNNS